MDNLSQQKLDAKLENAKRFNDSDYETSKSIDKYFQKNGVIYSLFFGLVIIPVLFIFFIITSFLISYLMPWFGSIIIITVGIVLYFYTNQLKKNNSLFIKEDFDKIELSTPLYYDLLLICSGLLFFSGIFLITISFEIIWILPFALIAAFYVYIRSYFRIRYSIFDKIIISKKEVMIDDPKSKDALSINKSDISKLVLLTVKDNSDERRILEFQFETADSYKTIEVDESQIKSLRLNFDLVTDSLSKMGYEMKKEIHIVGKINRIDENGNQLID